jgi:hypothetical protein
MAHSTRNKYPADKTGTKYSEFKNTKRVAPGKVKSAQTGGSDQSSGKTANSS